MKTISIKQPYASLIVSGIKDIENRSWKTSYRGRVLIHASAVPALSGIEELTPEQMQFAYYEIEDGKEIEPILTSAIIGSVEIVDCVQNHNSIWAEKGVWNWVLANPVKFKNPILGVKGKLSLWEFEQPKN